MSYRLLPEQHRFVISLLQEREHPRDVDVSARCHEQFRCGSPGPRAYVIPRTHRPKLCLAASRRRTSHIGRRGREARQRLQTIARRRTGPRRTGRPGAAQGMARPSRRPTPAARAARPSPARRWRAGRRRRSAATGSMPRPPARRLPSGTGACPYQRCSASPVHASVLSR